MKAYILERQKKMKLETQQTMVELHKAQTYKPKQKPLAENPYYLGAKAFTEKPFTQDLQKQPIPVQ